MYAGPLSLVTPDSLYRLETHLAELLEYHSQTSDIIRGWLEREALVDSIRCAHALGVNDARLDALQADLVKLDNLSTNLIRAIGVWSRCFGHFAVDVSGNPGAVSSRPNARAVFIWGGRDCVECIQTDSKALSLAELHALGASSPHSVAVVDGDGAWLSDWNFVPGTKPIVASAGRILPAPCPLVSATVAAQHFKVNDVLHAGPSPPWYNQKAARAGVQAIRRGICSSGNGKRT